MNFQLNIILILAPYSTFQLSTNIVNVSITYQIEQLFRQKYSINFY